MSSRAASRAVGCGGGDSNNNTAANAASPFLNTNGLVDSSLSPRTDANGTKTPTGNSAGSNNSSGGAAAKKGVRQLTEAQLEKKRANDREAQRAIRERTKKQIEALEQRIQDLESGEAYRQLQATVKLKEAVEAENYELKNRLAAVLEILRPMAANSFNLQNAQHLSPTPFAAFARPLAPPNDAFLSHTHTPSPYDRYRLGDASNGEEPPIIPSGAAADSYRNILASGPPWERANAKLDPPISPFPQASVSSASTPATETQSPFTPDESTDMASLKRKRPHFGESHMRTTMPPTPTSSTSTTTFRRNSTTYRPNAPTDLPNNVSPTCRLDTIIHDFSTESRRRLSTGMSLTDVVGPAYPVFNSMIDPQHPTMHAHPLSELFIEVLKGFSAISGLPEKIGVISLMFVFLRWNISPTLETFAALPPFLIPVEEQLRVAHPIWIDYIPWPRMRAKMVYTYLQLPLDNFFFPYSTTLALDFAGDAQDEMDRCLYRDGVSNELRARPELERTWRALERWSLGPYFVQTLPMLADSCRIREEKEGVGGESLRR